MRLLEKPFGPWKPLTFNSLLFKQGLCWLSKTLWGGSLNGIFVFPNHPSPAVFFLFPEVRIWVSVGKLMAGERASYCTTFSCDVQIVNKISLNHKMAEVQRHLRGPLELIWHSSYSHRTSGTQSRDHLWVLLCCCSHQLRGKHRN